MSVFYCLLQKSQGFGVEDEFRGYRVTEFLGFLEVFVAGRVSIDECGLLEAIIRVARPSDCLYHLGHRLPSFRAMTGTTAVGYRFE